MRFNIFRKCEFLYSFIHECLDICRYVHPYIIGIMDYRKAINFNPSEGTDRSACECFKTTGKLSDRLDMKFVISVLEIKANKLNNCNK